MYPAVWYLSLPCWALIGLAGQTSPLCGFYKEFVICDVIEANNSFNKFFKVFDVASFMKASVYSHKLAAVTIFPLTMVATAARRSYVFTMRLAICFRSSNAKNVALCLKVCPLIGKAWNQTRSSFISWVSCCWIIMNGDFHVSLFIQQS